MLNELEKVCSALDGLAEAVLSAWSGEQTMTEAFGWYAPALTRHDLAKMARSLAADIRSVDADAVDSEIESWVGDLPRRIQQLQVSVVPQLFGGNAGQAAPAFVTTIQTIRGTVLPGIGWPTLPDAKAMPAPLARRARAAKAALDQLEPTLTGLSQQVNEIAAAHEAAESLPADLQDLAEAREKMTQAATNIAVADKKAEDVLSSIFLTQRMIESHASTAEKLVKQCEDAYTITTSKGLAGAFDQRAGRLGWSMWIWVLGLVSALLLGSAIGAHRLELLSNAIQAEHPNWAAVAIQCVLSLISVGAPLWFAWLATKQIGQRFRLAEDYAFKASIAKAYEGYRKEAARIDPNFEHQLFGSALARLDEAPLRLVGDDTHGSPWHELASSDAARRALDAFPEVRDKMMELLREAIATGAKLTAKGQDKSDASKTADT
ncbi:conserved hypothetical protein [Cupriavidus taiwanensis]|nr:conserved hypothetical protein [Cupriavidus taiwanensis]SOZ53141.1 conserved hypothetical protein [Cupriavidus taiwanensis]